jgi:hypothetical protein
MNDGTRVKFGSDAEEIISLMNHEPEVITIPGGYIDGVGYGVQLVSLYAYEQLKFEMAELRAENERLKRDLEDADADSDRAQTELGRACATIADLDATIAAREHTIVHSDPPTAPDFVAVGARNTSQERCSHEE